MSEITRATIGMPFHMAMESELSRLQFHSIAQALLTERDRLLAEIAGLRTGYQAYERVNAELKAENGLLRQLASDTGLELRKASSWICREVEAGTKSATHWAVRLREKADHIDAAMGQGEQS